MKILCQILAFTLVFWEKITTLIIDIFYSLFFLFSGMKQSVLHILIHQQMFVK